MKQALFSVYDHKREESYKLRNCEHRLSLAITFGIEMSFVILISDSIDTRFTAWISWVIQKYIPGIL